MVGLSAATRTYDVDSVFCFFPDLTSGMSVGRSASCIFGHSLFDLFIHCGPSHRRGALASSTSPVPLEHRSAGFCLVGTCCH